MKQIHIWIGLLVILIIICILIITIIPLPSNIATIIKIITSIIGGIFSIIFVYKIISLNSSTLTIMPITQEENSPALEMINNNQLVPNNMRAESYNIGEQLPEINDINKNLNIIKKIDFNEIPNEYRVFLIDSYMKPMSLYDFSKIIKQMIDISYYIIKKTYSDNIYINNQNIIHKFALSIDYLFIYISRYIKLDQDILKILGDTYSNLIQKQYKYISTIVEIYRNIQNDSMFYTCSELKNIKSIIFNLKEEINQLKLILNFNINKLPQILKDKLKEPPTIMNKSIDFNILYCKIPNYIDNANLFNTILQSILNINNYEERNRLLYKELNKGNLTNEIKEVIKAHINTNKYKLSHTSTPISINIQPLDNILNVINI